jgi:hypothetical protein
MSTITTPVCATCGTKMCCKKNDFILGTNDGYSEIRWNGDLFSCPQCLIEVIIGFGKGYKVDPSSKEDLRLNCNIISPTKLP